MMYRAKHSPLENLRSSDRRMQSPSCADECLAGNVYLDISRVAVCQCVLARILHCQNCTICKCSHGLVVRFGNGNHSNLGLKPNKPKRNFAK